ncbi:MAG: PH domain-containing protein [Fimbriimonadaceae bacterium]|nr:PH domain-containing protein [Fimbriimonadaceae bacterium]QYK54734.1 MAG: PH domain-containing protein [Fimbriimonadaceae bacterium]
MRPPEFRRLHPGTIAVGVVNVLARFIYAIAIFVVVSLTGGRGDSLDMFVSLAGGFAVVVSIVRYLTFQFAVYEGKLVIREGLIVRTERTIPIDRIQNINLTRNVVHRMLGLVDFQIQTAAGTGVEASLNALGEEEAGRLQEELGGAKPSHASLKPVWLREDQPLYAAHARELFLLGATSNRAMAIIGTALGLTYIPSVRDRLFSGRLIENVVGSPLQGWVLLSAVLLLAGWLLSIGTAFVNYWDFHLALEDGRLRRTYGLFKQIENVIPLRRVQIVRIVEGPIQRLLKLARAYVETAGGMGIENKEHGREHDSHAPLVPLLGLDALEGLVPRFVPSAAFPVVQWHRIATATVWRSVRFWVVPALAFTALAYWRLGVSGLAVFPALLMWGWVLGRVRLRTCSFSDLETVFVARDGVFTRTTSYVPVQKIQSVRLTQSLSQRAFKLATVTVSTAGGSVHGAQAAVVDLPVETAVTLAESLHGRSLASAHENPDGF